MKISEAADKAAALMPDYQAYCEMEYTQWSTQDKPIWPHDFVWDINKAFDLNEQRGRRWHNYMTPLSVAWWKSHGFLFQMEGKYSQPSLSYEGEIITTH